MNEALTRVITFCPLIQQSLVYFLNTAVMRLLIKFFKLQLTYTLA